MAPLQNTHFLVESSFPYSIILFKGKPSLWLANPPMVRDRPTDPQPRIKVKIDGAYGVGGYGGTLTKYLLQVESPRLTQGRPLLLSVSVPKALHIE